MPFVVGAGATNIDLLYQNMPKIPNVGEEIYTDMFSLQLGGGLPATLINLGRLGVKTKIATELGSDMFSDFARKKYAENGVEPLNLYRGNGIPLNITSAIILKNDRSFITYGKGSIDPDENAKEEFFRIAKGAKICLMSAGGFIDIYKELKSQGTIMVLDTGWDEELSFEKYDELLTVADYFTPNRKEALKITGKSSEKGAAFALKKYFDKVVVKTDRDGCIGIDGDDFFFCPSLDRYKNVDSTGAGDAFLAGFVYGLLYDYPLKDCIEFGNITGGKAVTRVGALSAYVNEKELLEIKKEISEK